MARPKRKVNPLLPVTAPAESTQRIYQAGGYVRLSVEDSGRPGADTIETQRELIQSYITSQPDMQLYDLYCDNGRTGTNFDRPEFERLMDDVRIGKIDCIVVKDECDKIELKSESPQKCGFCDVSSVFLTQNRGQSKRKGGARRVGRPPNRQSKTS